MLVVTPCHAGDLDSLRRLLLWIQKLGACKNHQLLIVADAGSPFDGVIAIKELGEQIFGEARLTTNETSVHGWPDGCYSLFNAATKYIAENWPQPFLILEPDAIPLKPGWLDSITEAYQKAGTPFMGCIYDAPGFGSHGKAMSGIAVYPADTIKRLPPCPIPVHWDMYGADLMTQNGTHTPLIKHFFGTMALPPIFMDKKDESTPINAFTLDWIPEDCVLFHRDKQHGLIRLLTRKYFPDESLSTKIVVVFPVCGKDIGQAIHHAKWLRSMKRKWNHKALIAYDYTANTNLLNEFMRLLEPCFEKIEAWHYPVSGLQYPHAANFAFQSVAIKMSKQQAPWFWCEADLVVLNPGWIDQLQSEYERACKPFMGAIVPQMGHTNGTAIYPANAANIMPRVMSCGSGQAFDMVAKEDMGNDVHDCGHLLFHTWSVLGDQWHPVGGGQVPANITAAMAQRIPRSAVAIHRVKDFSLINLLVSGQYVHG